jgi:hypothetical protein
MYIVVFPSRIIYGFYFHSSFSPIFVLLFQTKSPTTPLNFFSTALIVLFSFVFLLGLEGTVTLQRWYRRMPPVPELASLLSAAASVIVGDAAAKFPSLIVAAFDAAKTRGSQTVTTKVAIQLVNAQWNKFVFTPAVGPSLTPPYTGDSAPSDEVVGYYCIFSRETRTKWSRHRAAGLGKKKKNGKNIRRYGALKRALCERRTWLVLFESARR